MGRVMVGALVLGLLVGGGGIAGLPGATAFEGSSAGWPSVERQAKRSFQAAGWWSLSEPGTGGARRSFEAAVWFPEAQVKGARCFAFEVQRTDTETTVTAYCDPGKGRRRSVANFDLASWIWTGDLGERIDFCRDRHNMRRNNSFTCTVRTPNLDGGNAAGYDETGEDVPGA